ncbi:MAG: diguanylate cyclase [Anaerolineales bacterium]|nr:diguanylate cyclase [Anaerolineales bacterium]
MEAGRQIVSATARFKWIFLGILFLVITVYAIIDLTQGENPVSLVIKWLLLLAVSGGVVELGFRQVNKLQNQLGKMAGASEQKARHKDVILQLNSRLAASMDEAEICRIAVDTLQNSLGYKKFSLYLSDPVTGAQTHYGTWNEASANLSSRQAATNEPTRVYAPLRRGSQTLGGLVIESPPDSVITLEEETNSIHAIADQIALAIANARLFSSLRLQQTSAETRQEELRQRERYHSLLNFITRAALQNRDYQAMLQTLTEHLGRLYDAESCVLALWDEVHEHPIPMAASGPLRQVARTLQFESAELGMMSNALNTGKALVVQEANMSLYVSPRLSAQLQARSLITLPLVADQQKLGVAILAFEKQRTFDEDEIASGEQAASQIALALAKVNALNTAQQKAHELAALQRGAAALLSTLDLEALLGQFLDESMSAIPADKGMLHLVAPETGELQIRAMHGYTDPRIRPLKPIAENSLTARAVRERKPLLVNDIQADTALNHHDDDLPDERQAASTIIAPLTLGSQTLGAISLSSYRRHAFSETDLQLLVSFAAMATTAINNAQLHAAVQKQAVTDTLTKLYNRRGLFDLAQREVMRAHRFQHPLCAMLLDIDHFKQINDTHGHQVGDQILAGVSTEFTKTLRQVDLVGRYGGDEFIALLPETDLPQAMAIAERLRKSVSEMTFNTPTTQVKITISVGVAVLGKEDTLETLIKNTDLALYRAKEKGRNVVGE